MENGIRSSVSSIWTAKFYYIDIYSHSIETSTNKWTMFVYDDDTEHDINEFRTLCGWNTEDDLTFYQHNHLRCLSRLDVFEHVLCEVLCRMRACCVCMGINVVLIVRNSNFLLDCFHSVSLFIRSTKIRLTHKKKNEQCACGSIMNPIIRHILSPIQGVPERNVNPKTI